MVDESTTNKNYPLPHPSNIESQDVERIATAISMIDADVQSCFNTVANASSIAESWANKTLKIPTELVGQVDTELQNLQPGQYIVVNDDATGFTTVEGGGGEGGKKGEILVKKSDANFDTTWIDPRAVLKKAPTIKETTSDIQLQNNSTVILSDTQELEVADDTPRHGLTQRQINSDITADSYYTYVLCDTIDDTAEDESDIATNEKFGRVKIGSGINVNDGVISVQTIGLASENNFGMVKIGSGLEIQDGVVSTQAYPHADADTFGLVKPGSDFYFDSNGALNVVKRSEDIIYQKAFVNVVDDSIIKIVPTCAHYRAFINTDTLFSFEFGDFVPKDDISFDLEICSDGEYIIRFDYDIIWGIGCAGVSRGTTIIHFEKLLGISAFRGTLVSADTSEIRFLTPDTTEDITDNYVARHSGCNVQAKAILAYKDIGAIRFAKSDSVLNVNFTKSTYVESIKFHLYRGTITYMYVEGSVDGFHWKRLLSVNESCSGSATFSFKLTSCGFFKHYRIKTGPNNSADFLGIALYGFNIEDERYELQRVMPIMQTDSANGYVITSSGLTSGNLYDVTTDTTGSFANFETRLDGQYWVKYELPEAKSVDMIDLGARNGTECNRMPTWFKLEGSNDDENWDLLIERAYLTQWYQSETRQYWIYNQTPYKFYRLLSIEQPTAYFSLSRFRLYKKIEGTVPLEGFVPILSSVSQGGYIASCSSVSTSSRSAHHAFDNNTGTAWVSGENNIANEWLQIKFPTETLCTAVWLRPRNDEYYIQAPTSFEILGSNDGENFVTIKTFSELTWTQTEQKVLEFYNTNAYLYYRIHSLNVCDGGTRFALSKLNFGTLLREYKRELNRYEYLIPKMSANSQDGYIASALAYYSVDYAPWKAFNKTADGAKDCWATSDAYKTDGSGNCDVWLQVQLPIAKVADTLEIYPCSTAKTQAPKDFVLMGSNNGNDWTNLLTKTNQTGYNPGSWSFENSTAYLYYRLRVTKTNANNTHVAIGQLNLIYHTLTREY